MWWNDEMFVSKQSIVDVKKLKNIGLFSKQARGSMARWIIQNDIQTVDELKKFAETGYKYNPKLSSDSKMVFTRQAK